MRYTVKVYSVMDEVNGIEAETKEEAIGKLMNTRPYSMLSMDDEYHVVATEDGDGLAELDEDDATCDHVWTPYEYPPDSFEGKKGEKARRCELCQIIEGGL